MISFYRPHRQAQGKQNYKGFWSGMRNVGIFMFVGFAMVSILNISDTMDKKDVPQTTFQPAVQVNASNVGGDLPVNEGPTPQPKLEPEKPKAPAAPAKSALSVEFSSEGDPSNPSGQGKVLFSRNSDEQLPIASLTKLMTGLVALENYPLEQEATISEEAMKQEGVQGVLKAGEILTIENLLYITLMESSNRAAYALAEVIGNDNFVALMNEKAGELGLENTQFADATGLSEKSHSNAEDLVKLSKHLFDSHPLFRQIISQKDYDLYLPDGTLHHKLENTNLLLGRVRNIVGGKTGYTVVAKGCLMAIQEDAQIGTYTIHVILGSEDRFGEMVNILEEIKNKP